MKDSFKNYSNNSLLPSFENVLNFSFGKIESFTVLQSFLLHVIHVFISYQDLLTNGRVSPSFHFSAILFDYACNTMFVKIDTL